MGRRPNPKPSVDLFDDLADPVDLVADMFISLAVKRKIMSYTEFSRTIKIPSRNDPNVFSYYDPASDRVQELFLGLLDKNEYAQYIWCAPPQIAGKSLIAVMVPTMRDLFERRVAVGYGLPTGEDINKSWSDKLKPSIDESGFGGFMPESGPGARGGRAPSIRFEDSENNVLLGRLAFLTMKAYGTTVQVSIADELDQFFKGGEPYRQGMVNIFSRSASSGSDAINIGCGTVEHDEDSLILSEIRSGTHFRLAHKCPHCSGYFRAEFGFDTETGSRLVYEVDAGESGVMESARYVCGVDGCVLDEEDRQEAISNAELIGKDQAFMPGKGIVGPINETNASLLTHELDCVRGEIGLCAKKHYLAKKAIDEEDSHGAMRMFYRYSMCAEYTGDTDLDTAGMSVDLSCAELHRKSAESTYDRGIIPSGFTYCILSIDVQHSRCYFVLSAFSRDQCADIEMGYEMFCKHGQQATFVEKCQGLDRAIENALEICLDNEVQLASVAVDFGDKQAELEAWLKITDYKERVRPIKGIGDEQAKGMGKGKMVNGQHQDKVGVYHLRAQQGGWQLMFIDTDSVRHKVQNAYRMDADKPGSNLLPKGLLAQDYFFKHLTSAKWAKQKSGRMKWEQAKRVDLLDCKIYQAAVNVRIRDTVGIPYDMGESAETDTVKVAEETAKLAEEIVMEKNARPKARKYRF